MEKQQPIFTQKTECQDCYKCVRNCPVKAIQVQNDSATVIPERCVLCGTCVQICPVGAKKVRDDLSIAKELINNRKAVYASLAPSFVGEFRGIRPEQIIRALRVLGFAGVSETALGAQLVSAEIVRQLRQETKPQLHLSSACPAAVELISKYVPELTENINQIASPVLAHARLLRQLYGNDIGVVFISPCVAKKREADSFKDVLDVAITFEDLQQWFDEEHISLAGLATGPRDIFIPEAAGCGTLYPIDGGMNEGIRAAGGEALADFDCLSGIEAILQGLDGLRAEQLKKSIFVELLACEGGCVNGPRRINHTGTLLKRGRIKNYTSQKNQPQPENIPAELNLEIQISSQPTITNSFSEREIIDALRQVGKFSPHDELNCGGCGYDNCRLFARALLAGNAERTMCVSYMRKLAQNKANALMRSMPSGVVLVDNQLKIVECNARFATMMGEEAEMIFQAKPGMEGAELKRITPFAKLFCHVLDNGLVSWEKEVRVRGSIFHVTFFSIEPGQLVGAILRDITEPVVHKEHIIKKTHEVMRKNLEAVQQIAFLLGENAAESEGILNSIIESFGSDEIETEDKTAEDKK